MSYFWSEENFPSLYYSCYSYCKLLQDYMKVSPDLHNMVNPTESSSHNARNSHNKQSNNERIWQHNCTCHDAHLTCWASIPTSAGSHFSWLVIAPHPVCWLVNDWSLTDSHFQISSSKRFYWRYIWSHIFSEKYGQEPFNVRCWRRLG